MDGPGFRSEAGPGRWPSKWESTKFLSRFCIAAHFPRPPPLPCGTDEPVGPGFRKQQPMPLADDLAQYAVGLEYSRLDEATVHEVRRRIIDTLACALGAWRAPAPQV